MPHRRNPQAGEPAGAGDRHGERAPRGRLSYTYVRGADAMDYPMNSPRSPNAGHSAWSSPSRPTFSGRHSMQVVGRMNPYPSEFPADRYSPQRSFSAADYDAITYHTPRHRRRPSARSPAQPINVARLPTSQWRPVWPPPGVALDSLLLPNEAAELVTVGASTFKGYVDPVPHAPTGSSRHYAVMEDAHEQRSDKAELGHLAFKDISLTITGARTSFPWLCLEQPSMASCFGKYPGTTSLNYKVGASGCLTAPIQFGADVVPRQMGFLALLDRLMRLERGLEGDIEHLHDELYTNLLYNEAPGPFSYKAMEAQITDLITVLSNPQWVDFGLSSNQVMAKFFDSSDEVTRRLFYHQLLLSTELFLRIHDQSHSEKAKKKLLLRLPPKIAWDLAVAQRWSENMQIKKKSLERSPGKKAQSTFSFVPKNKERQKAAMRTFAAALKWPNMDEVDYVLQETDEEEDPLEERSAEATSWFLGTMLPGQSFPWILMNALIDCDRDSKASLRYLTPLQPASGFQYRANTYWSHRCIVGKVLGAARGVGAIAGWVGPCFATTDLKRTECARINQPRSSEAEILAADVQDMSTRSDPLGPTDLRAYPAEAFDLLIPERRRVINSIRMEKLTLRPVNEQDEQNVAGTPLEWHAVINFAFGSQTKPLWLKYDVDFVTAFPCEDGPHALFHTFKYRAVPVGEQLLIIHDWAARGQHRGPSQPDPAFSPPSPQSMMAKLAIEDQPSAHRDGRRRDSDAAASFPGGPTFDRPSDRGQARAGGGDQDSRSIQKVLVVEAFGVSDNEVLARAWCAYKGVSAIVADVHETCMACAIREAYAACVTVVILTEGGDPYEKDEGVRP